MTDEWKHMIGLKKVCATDKRELFLAHINETLLHI